jgi:hypothetical protein
MREQRLVFGEVAELYDRARAAFSEAVIDDVLRFAGGDGSRLRAREGGAGTGKATVAFAVRGLAIVAIEPSAAMAAVARRNCKPFPNVRLECTTFEDWAVEASPFDLVFSAQAWHWVTPEVRYVKAAEALAGGGTLALFWHRTRWQGEELRAELEDLYRRLVPEIYAKDPGFPGLTQPRGDDRLVDEIKGSGLFGEPTMHDHPWSATFTADTFVELLLTQSDHRLLPEATRAELFEAVRSIVTAHGGELVVPHTTLLALALRR